LSLSARISPTFQPQEYCFSLTTNQSYKSAVAAISPAEQDRKLKDKANTPHKYGVTKKRNKIKKKTNFQQELE